MRTRLILIAATWAAVVGLVAGSAHAQSPTPPGGQFVLVGVVVLEGERGLAFVQEPNFTGNKVVTVRLGDSVGPYRVTKILSHLVELTGPGGTVSVPLAGTPGAGGVASSAGPSSPAAVQRPASGIPAAAGPVTMGFKPPDPSAPTAKVPAPTVTQEAGNELPPHPALNNPNAVVIPRGDPRRAFPTSKMFPGS